MTFIYAFIASLLYVFLRAQQQLNVFHNATRWVVPNSLGMAACEVFVMVNVVKTLDSFGGLVLLASCIGFGSGIGCLGAMYMRSRRAKPEPKPAPDTRVNSGRQCLDGGICNCPYDTKSCPATYIRANLIKREG